MGANSKIEWTDHTWSPWRGCEQVKDHPACDNCYAMRMAKLNPGTLGRWGSVEQGGTRIVAVEKYWELPKKWNADAARRGVIERVFVDSISDFFEDFEGPLHDHKGNVLYPVWWDQDGHWNTDGEGKGLIRLKLDAVRRRVFSIIDACPNLIFMLLTKRPQNIMKMWADFTTKEWGSQRNPVADQIYKGITVRRENVWLGTTISNQKTADQYIPELLQCRDLAPVLFVSAEPLLGPVDLRQWTEEGLECNCGWRGCEEQAKQIDIDDDSYFECPRCKSETGHTPLNELLGDGIKWLICGGESGHGARPMHPDWARSLRDQCTAAGVPFFFKQWGEWLPDSQGGRNGACHEWPDGSCSINQGKKYAGRELDGRTWDELPTIEGVHT